MLVRVEKKHYGPGTGSDLLPVRVIRRRRFGTQDTREGVSCPRWVADVLMQQISIAAMAEEVVKARG